VTKRSSKLTLPYFQKLFEDNDIVLLTETWTSVVSDIEVEGFEYIVLNRTEKLLTAKRDSGGLILYFRKTISKGVQLYHKECDDIIWVKLKADFFGLDRDVFMCLCYVLPVASARVLFSDVNIFDRIMNTIAKIQHENDQVVDRDVDYILVGDFNSRTGVEPDYLDENDNVCDFVPVPDDYRPDVNNIPRVSRDGAGLNANGRQLLALCKACGLRIVNGRSGRDKGVGDFTFVNRQGRSVIDYVIVNEDKLDTIHDFTVHSPNVYSDHCQLSFVLYGDTCVDCDDSHNKTGVRERKFVWDSALADQYTARLDSVDTRRRLSEIDNLIDSQVPLGEESVSDIVYQFTNILQDTAQPLFEKTFTSNSGGYRGRPDWYTDECELKRKHFLDCLNRYRESDTVEARTDMVKARSCFKSEARRCRYAYDIRQTDKLLKARRENAKDYWKLLQHTSRSANCNISCDNFSKYFKCVNNPDDLFLSL
jgi:hypothetical protein